jgi:type IV pilus assembly protein PilO
MADTKSSSLPLGVQFLIAIGVAAVLLGGFYFAFYQDMLAEHEKKSGQLKVLNEQIRALEVTAAKLPEFQREVAVLEMKLETLKRVLPPEKETPDLMRKLQNLASESNLRIQAVSPGAIVPKDFYQEVPFTLTVDGSYHNLALFFDRVGRLSRLVNAGGIKIAGKSTQTPLSTVTASCVATTFVYLETPVGAAPAPGGARAGAKGVR